MPELSITTIESALATARAILKDTSDSYQQDARLLLGEVMGVSQEYLIRYPEKALTTQQVADFQQLVARRARGEPIAYLIGRQAFYDIEVFVTPDVLIPRPETELLVEKAIEWGVCRHTFIVDVGAGSGIIALVLAKHLLNTHITGIDISPTALELAKRNSVNLGLENRIRWIQGNLLKPLVEMGETADLIVANLPYVAAEDLKTLEVSRYEPHLALDGGADGLDLIRQFLSDAPSVLRPNGLILMEVGAGQGQAVKDFAQSIFPHLTVKIESDLAGHDRIISIQ